jgi:hypothetical protein
MWLGGAKYATFLSSFTLMEAAMSNTFPHIPGLSRAYCSVTPVGYQGRDGYKFKEVVSGGFETGYYHLIPSINSASPLRRMALFMEFLARGIDPFDCVITVQVPGPDIFAFRLSHNSMVTQFRIQRHSEEGFPDVDFENFSSWEVLQSWLKRRGIGMETQAIIRRFLVDGLALPEKLPVAA